MSNDVGLLEYLASKMAWSWSLARSAASGSCSSGLWDGSFAILASFDSGSSLGGVLLGSGTEYHADVDSLTEGNFRECKKKQRFDP
jgi:hypothetical protein